MRAGRKREKEIAPPRIPATTSREAQIGTRKKCSDSIFNPMKMGLTGVYMPKFDVDRWFDVVERDRPMMIFLVPAMAERAIRISILFPETA